MDRKRKVGLLGGTFNPVHEGHVDLGLKIREAFRLNNVLYILSANPPHKKAPHIAEAELRWKMLNIALSAYPFLEPCDIEMKRSQDSWTIDTIQELQQLYPDDYFYFISGSEGFLKIRTWKNYKRLLRMIPFIIVARDSAHKEEVIALLSEEGMVLADAAGPHDNPAPIQHIEYETGAVNAAYWYNYRSDKLFISSTLIRRRVKEQERIHGLVHEEVRKIMEEQRLYEK